VTPIYNEILSFIKNKKNALLQYKNGAILLWWWFKARKKGFCYDLNHWMLNPKVCIGLHA
jgi:hypothetical protein